MTIDERPAVAVADPIRQPNEIVIGHLGDDRFVVGVRDHVITVDQPIDQGGDDTAPTPTELFVTSIGACVGFYVRRFLTRHQFPTDGLAIRVRYEMANRPARVGRVQVAISLPDGFPVDRRDRLLTVASHCTVHNSLVTPPSVSVTLAR